MLQISKHDWGRGCADKGRVFQKIKEEASQNALKRKERVTEALEIVKNLDPIKDHPGVVMHVETIKAAEQAINASEGTVNESLAEINQIATQVTNGTAPTKTNSAPPRKMDHWVQKEEDRKNRKRIIGPR